MADKKITDLPELVTPLGTDEIEIVNSGDNKRISVANLQKSLTAPRDSFDLKGHHTRVGMLIDGEAGSTAQMQVIDEKTSHAVATMQYNSDAEDYYFALMSKVSGAFKTLLKLNTDGTASIGNGMVQHNIATVDDIAGFLKADGSVTMDASYVPTLDGDVMNASATHRMIHQAAREYDVTVHMNTAGNAPTHAECLQAFGTLPNHDFAEDDRFYIMSDTKDKLSEVKYLSNGSTDASSTTFQFFAKELKLTAGSPSHVPIAVLESFTLEEAAPENIVVSIVGEDLSIGSNTQEQERKFWSIFYNGIKYEPRSISYVGGNVVLNSMFGFNDADAVTVSYDGLGTTTGSTTGALHAFTPQNVTNNITTGVIKFQNLLTYPGATYTKLMTVNFDGNVANINNQLGWLLKNQADVILDLTGLAASAAQLQLNTSLDMIDGDVITVSYDGLGAMEDANGVGLKPFSDSITYTA